MPESKENQRILQQLVAATSLEMCDNEIPEAPALRDKKHYRRVELTGQEKSELRFVECHFSQLALDKCHFRKIHLERCVIDSIQLLACNISELTVSGCEISNVTTEACEIAQCLICDSTLTNIKLNDAFLDGITLNQTQVERVECSATRLSHWSIVNSSVQSKVVNNSMLSDVSWYKSSLTGGRYVNSDVQRLVISHCQLSGCHFEQLSGSNFIWNDSQLVDVMLTRLPLQGTSMMKARLTRCNLAYSALTGAIMTRATLVDCSLAHSDMTSCQAEEVTFERCNLLQVCLQEAQLNGAKFISTPVTGANFNSADLRAARMTDGTFHDVASRDNVRLHQVQGEGWGKITPEPLLSDIDCWYELNQPGIPEAVLPSFPRATKGGSRYVQSITDREKNIRAKPDHNK